jgi:hypothetical protein
MSCCRVESYSVLWYAVRYVDACPMSVSERRTGVSTARDSSGSDCRARARAAASGARLTRHYRHGHRQNLHARALGRPRSRPMVDVTRRVPIPPNGRNPPRGRAPGTAPVLHTAAATARAKCSAPITARVPARSVGEESRAAAAAAAAPPLAYRASNRESSAESVTCGSSSAYAAAFASWRRELATLEHAAERREPSAARRRVVDGCTTARTAQLRAKLSLFSPPAPPNSAPTYYCQLKLGGNTS